MKKFLGILSILLLTFVFVACKDDTDQKKVDEVYDWLELPGLSNELTNSSERIIMPKEKDGVSISWVIDKPDYIDANGVISQPIHEVGDQVVELEATLSLNDAKKTKTFKGTVLALPPLEDTKPLLDEDFKSYQDGDMKDQEGKWAVVSNKAGSTRFSIVSSIAGSTIPDSSNALKVEAFTERTLETPLQHSYNFVVIEADLMQTSSSNATSINIQSSASSPAVAFGLNGKTLYYRVDNGDQIGFEVEMNKWYRARFEVDLENKTIELFYYEDGQLLPVTPGKVAFTTATSLTSLFIRSGSSTTEDFREPAYITNIMVNREEALPRPTEAVKLGEVTGIEDLNIEKGGTFSPAELKVYNYYGDARELIKDTDYTLTIDNPVDTDIADIYEVVYTLTNKTSANDVKVLKQKVNVYETETPNVITNAVSTVAVYPEYLSDFSISFVQPAGDLYYLLSNNETATAEEIKAGTKVEITSDLLVLEDILVENYDYIHFIVVHYGDSNIMSHQLSKKSLTEISTPEEFYNMTQTSQSEQVETYFLLKNDLDFTYFDWENAGKKFSGILDGDGFIISNLTITAPADTYGGIFRELEGATIKNLGFDNVEIISTNQRAGIIAGRTDKVKSIIENLTFDNCRVIAGDSTTLGSDIYGALIIGRATGDAEISNIKVIASEVHVNGKYVGGLVGYAEANLLMSDIDAEIKVTEESTKAQLVGGIVGRVGSKGNLTLMRIIAKVDLTGTKNIGGLLGKNDGEATVIDALVRGTLNATESEEAGAISGNKSFNEFTNIWAVAVIGEGEGTNKQSAPAENTLTTLYEVSTSTWWAQNMPNILASDLWDTAGFASLIREEVLKHKIEFVLADLVVDPIEVRDNSLAVLPVPEKIGFVFVGWFTDEDHTIPFDEETLIDADLVLYGMFEEIDLPLYTVSFDSNEGSLVEEQVIVEGELATKPADPLKDGFAFVGWYIDLELENEYSFDTPVTDEITLYAKWVPLYTIMIETNGGVALLDGKEVTSILVAEGDLLPELSFEKLSYNFLALFTDEDLTEVFAMDTLITQDLTLYVGWEEGVVNYLNNADEFIAFLNNPKAEKYLLTADIDLSDKTYTPNSFAGILDGGGYTISNLTYSGGDQAGLFVYLRGEVRNLKFVDASITSTGRAGLIAGEIDALDVIIENIDVDGLTVTGNNSNGVAGLVAVIKKGAGGATFSKIRMNNVNVSNDDKNAAAILGYSRGAGATIINDIHLTNITVQALEHAGGVVGYIRESVSFALNRAFLENVTLEAEDYMGAIAGRVDETNRTASDVMIKGLTITGLATGKKYFNVVAGRNTNLTITAVFGGNFTLPKAATEGQTVLEEITDFELLDEAWFDENLPLLTTGAWALLDGKPVLIVFPSE